MLSFGGTSFSPVSRPHSHRYSQIFTGKPPFYGLRDHEVIYKVMVEREGPEIPDSAPPELKQLYPTLKQCWASEPRHRPSVNEIVILVSDISYDVPFGVPMSTFVHGTPYRRRSYDVPRTASATTFGSSGASSYRDPHPLITTRHFSVAPARKPREQYPEYAPRVPFSPAASKVPRKLEEGGGREEAETRWEAAEAETKWQREGAQPLRDVLRDVTIELTDATHLYSLATQQLLPERLHHIAVLDGCFVELDPFPVGFVENIKRLEDTFRSFREPEVHIDG
jgi:hypothetical protein